MTTADKIQAQREEHLRKEEARRDEAALRYLLSDKRGRWFISRMLERCNVYSVAGGDMSQILLCEGARRVGVELHDNLRTLAALDETGQCYEDIHQGEREYGAFLARYKREEN